MADALGHVADGLNLLLIILVGFIVGAVVLVLTVAVTADRVLTRILNYPKQRSKEPTKWQTG